MSRVSAADCHDLLNVLRIPRKRERDYSGNRTATHAEHLWSKLCDPNGQFASPTSAATPETPPCREAPPPSPCRPIFSPTPTRCHSPTPAHTRTPCRVAAVSLVVGRDDTSFFDDPDLLSELSGLGFSNDAPSAAAPLVDLMAFSGECESTTRACLGALVWPGAPLIAVCAVLL